MGENLGFMHFVFLWLAEILGKFAKFATSAGIAENLNSVLHSWLLVVFRQLELDLSLKADVSIFLNLAQKVTLKNDDLF